MPINLFNNSLIFKDTPSKARNAQNRRIQKGGYLPHYPPRYGPVSYTHLYGSLSLYSNIIFSKLHKLQWKHMTNFP